MNPLISSNSSQSPTKYDQPKANFDAKSKHDSSKTGSAANSTGTAGAAAAATPAINTLTQTFAKMQIKPIASASTAAVAGAGAGASCPPSPSLHSVTQSLAQLQITPNVTATTATAATIPQIPNSKQQLILNALAQQNIRLPRFISGVFPFHIFKIPRNNPYGETHKPNGKLGLRSPEIRPTDFAIVVRSYTILNRQYSLLGFGLAMINSADSFMTVGEIIETLFNKHFGKGISLPLLQVEVYATPSAFFFKEWKPLESQMLYYKKGTIETTGAPFITKIQMVRYAILHKDVNIVVSPMGQSCAVVP